MKITVNGEEKAIESNSKKISLSLILNKLGYEPKTIVVEVNEVIVNSKKWDETAIKNGDKLEIVTIVGGGS